MFRTRKGTRVSRVAHTSVNFNDNDSLRRQKKVLYDSQKACIGFFLSTVDLLTVGSVQRMAAQCHQARRGERLRHASSQGWCRRRSPRDRATRRRLLPWSNSTSPTMGESSVAPCRACICCAVLRALGVLQTPPETATHSAEHGKHHAQAFSRTGRKMFAGQRVLYIYIYTLLFSRAIVPLPDAPRALTTPDVPPHDSSSWLRFAGALLARHAQGRGR